MVIHWIKIFVQHIFLFLKNIFINTHGSNDIHTDSIKIPKITPLNYRGMPMMKMVGMQHIGNFC